MAYMIDFAVLFLESLLTLVTHVLFCYLYLSAHVVDLVQICYPCIVMLLWLFYTLEHTQWRSDPISHKCYLAACYIRQPVKMNLENTSRVLLEKKLLGLPSAQNEVGSLKS